MYYSKRPGELQFPDAVRIDNRPVRSLLLDRRAGRLALRGGRQRRYARRARRANVLRHASAAEHARRLALIDPFRQRHDANDLIAAAPHRANLGSGVYLLLRCDVDRPIRIALRELRAKPSLNCDGARRRWSDFVDVHVRQLGTRCCGRTYFLHDDLHLRVQIPWTAVAEQREVERAAGTHGGHGCAIRAIMSGGCG